MPNVGEIRTASEIGYRGHCLYKYAICSSCSKQRWVRVKEMEQGRGLVCRSCGYPSTNFHKRKLLALRDAGAMRASEIGKPVFKNRDPWYYKHICRNCGNEVWHQKRDLNRACSECTYAVRQTLSGEAHPNWKGGRYYNGEYIVVQLKPDDAYYAMCHARGCVLEHRLVMARDLGRCLSDSEVVHHINGNKRDNRISNLELLPNDVSHLPYVNLQRQVASLELKVKDQDKQIRTLRWRIKELEQGNPEPSRRVADSLGVCRDFTGDTQ